MRIEQLQLFRQKGDFDASEFESESNKQLFRKIASSVSNAFSIFSSNNITAFDNSTRANMLNNLVVYEIQKHCQQEGFQFYPSLTGTRRSLAILNDKYILFFKKSPVSNIKTNQDDMIKNQELDKHIVFLVYTVDEFWSSISKLEFLYYVSPESWTYNFDITSYLTDGFEVGSSPEIGFSQETREIVKPTIKIKEKVVRMDQQENTALNSDAQLMKPTVEVKKQAAKKTKEA